MPLISLGVILRNELGKDLSAVLSKAKLGLSGLGIAKSYRTWI